MLLNVACNEIETIKIQRLFIVYFQLSVAVLTSLLGVK